jgi:protein-tyrosine phosphatase
MKILMVCLGNICRSPMAEGILQQKLKEHHLDKTIQVDSCGFDRYRQGDPPFYMAIQTAKKHGINIENQKQRLLTPDDFDCFDKIYIMDSNNYRLVKNLARNDDDMKKVDYLLNVVYPNENRHVPDPWNGTEKNYEHAFQLIEMACEKIVEWINKKSE